VIEFGGASVNSLDIELGIGLGEPYLCRFRPERRKLETELFFGALYLYSEFGMVTLSLV